MRFFRVVLCLASCTIGASSLLLFGQVAGPAQRQITDPQTIKPLSNDKARALSIEDLFFTRAVNGASWSPDGQQIVFTTNITGRSNLWKVPASGGWPIQLTQSEDRQYGAAWSPDGKWIVFQQDTGGNELWDLFAVPSDGGELVNLTNTPNVREESPLWSHDSKNIAFNSKPKQATVYDVAMMDWRTRKTRKLTEERAPDRIWAAVAWSPDDSTLYANRLEVSFTELMSTRLTLLPASRRTLPRTKARLCSRPLPYRQTVKPCSSLLIKKAAIKTSPCWMWRPES